VTSGNNTGRTWTGVSELLDPTCDALGIVADSIAPGRAVLRLTVTDAMTNAHGMAHGGYLFLLADAAFAFAVNSGEPMTVATGAQITFVKPAFSGDELSAETVERVRYGRNRIVDVTVRKADGSVVAEFRGQSVSSSGRPA
jgi:acyl-CoA thioesterase